MASPGPARCAGGPPSPGTGIQSRDRLHVLSQVRGPVVGGGSLPECARWMAEQLRAAFVVDACIIRLLQGDDLVFLASAGLPESSCPERIPVACGIASEILKRHSPLFLADVTLVPSLTSEQSKPPSPRAFTSYAGAPMLAGDQVIGIIGLYSRTKREDLTQEDMDCLQLIANSLSATIANNRLYGQLLRQHEALEREVAARHQVERSLAEAEQRLRLAATVARMFAFEWDPVTDRAARSADAAGILGPKENSAHTTGKEFLARLHPDDRASLAAQLARLSPSCPGYHTAYRYVREDGQVVWLEETSQGYFDREGRLVRLIGMTADITERKRAEDDTRKLRDELSRMGRVTTMGELTATIAHEVNQPLGAIMTNTEICQGLLSDTVPDLDEVRRALADIAHDASRATQIVTQVREFLGKTEARFDYVDMNRVIRQVLRMLDDRFKADRILPELHLSPESSRIWGSEGQLQQVMLNLLTNAIESMDSEGSGPCKLAVSSRSADREGLLVVVEDSGTGIPAHDLERIFDPFFTTKPSGLGMGLAICRSIVERHGGRMWAESVGSGGAAFKFTLPAERAIGK